MKQVELKIYVLIVHPQYDDAYVLLYRTHEQCIEYMYEIVEQGWNDHFDDDPIDEYTHQEAVNQYYGEADDVGYYDISVEHVAFTVMELQDEIAKAIGLATHG